jgi:hypothetical protein
MKITKKRLKQIIQEELETIITEAPLMTYDSRVTGDPQKRLHRFTGGRDHLGRLDPGVAGSWTQEKPHVERSGAHMTVDEVERAMANAGVDGLMYGHAVELMNALDRANIDRRGFEDMLRNLPHHTKTTGRPYSALSWIHKEIG